MAASVRQQGDRILLEGAVDFDNAAAIHAAGLELVRQSGPSVIVDLAGMQSENSITVAIIVQWLRVAASAGKTLSLADVPAQFRSIVGVSGLSTVLLPETTGPETANPL
jgi:phospholipid transport system transporter-binding protein